MERFCISFIEPLVDGGIPASLDFERFKCHTGMVVDFFRFWVNHDSIIESWVVLIRNWFSILLFLGTIPTPHGIHNKASLHAFSPEVSVKKNYAKCGVLFCYF